MKHFDAGQRSKPDTEFSDYQKDILATDNVILCVAKAEKMVREMGRSLLSDEQNAGDNVVSDDMPDE
jgi:hypothetical protein